MSAAQELLSRLDGLEVKLWHEQGQLRFRAPKGVMTEELRSELRQRKAELLAVLDGQAASIPRIADQPSYPLSHAQWRMWVLSQLEDGSAAYNIPLHQLLEGPLDVDAMKRAIEQFAERHESLRTSIVMVDGEPRQKIHEQVDAGLHFIDLSDCDDPLAAAQQLAHDHARQLLDLERGPLFRAALARLDDNHHVLLFTIHHIVCDGVSIGILGNELTRFYEAIRRGEPRPFPPLRIQYRDYADWQHTLMQSGALAEHRDWWLQTLGDLPPVLELPTDFPRLAVQTFDGRELSFRLPSEKLDALRQLGRQHNASLFMTLLAALYVLLYKCTGQEDLIVGSPMAGRNHPDLENQFGLYLNTIALRNQIDGEAPFAEFLEQVRQTTAEAFDHQSYPFDQLLSELNVARDLSRNPLFDVTMILQNQHDTGLTFDDVTARSFVTHAGTSKTDLTFNFNETLSGLNVAIEYNTDLFVDDRIARMVGHFCQLVDDLLQEPRRSIGALNMLTVEETRELLDRFNATSRSYPSDKTVVGLFEQQARRNPDTVAVQCEDAQATYRELADRVNQVARHLRSLGVGRNVLVGVCMDRGIDMVAAVLAVMKAGGAYVPLDPSFPYERLALMLSDSRAPVLLTQSTLLGRLPESTAHVVCLDSDGALDTVAALAMPPLLDNPAAGRATAADLAYVIYTSGSTGGPKGVCIPQRALVNFLCSMAREPGLTADDVLLAVTTLSFDIAALEIFLPLIQGAKLVLATRETATDGMRLLEMLDRCGATVMQGTPATWRMLLAAGWRASPQLKALCGGEALPVGLADQLLERCASVWNMYGPTETTIWSTIRRLNVGVEPRDAIEPIGRPIANTEVYILDRHIQPVPIGVPGDMYIGGDGLAAGYHNRADLTAERFLPHPFRRDGQRRVYKTGDSACYRSDGTIEFLGRTDQQIKLRGFRIELGEIEAALATHPAIAQAVADMRDDGAGDQRLVSWYLGAAAEEVTSGELRDYLKAKLPDYMLPTLLVRVGEIPLTPNGKVDRKALALPQPLESPSSDYKPPRSEWEKAIAEIWQEVLQVRRIAVHDNFFELGGHSLKATQVVSRMHRELSVEIALREIFSQPTVAGLAQIAAGKQSRPFVAIAKIADAEHYELSHGQRRLWVLAQMAGGLAAYNLPAALLLEGNVDAAALQKSLDAVVQRHESLRTSFVVVDGLPRQKVSPRVAVQIRQIDLSREAEPEQRARQLALADAGQAFDLTSAGLLRVSLLKLTAERWLLLFNIHHIIADQWSLDVLVREFAELYDGRRELAPLRVQYRDYAHWQNRYLDSDDARAHHDYWLGKLAGDRSVLNLPTDSPRPPTKTFNGKTHSWRLDREQTAALQSFSQQRGASLFMTLVAVVNTLLYRYTGQEDLILGFPIAGRNHADLETQIGFFVNTLPLRSQVREGMTFDELLEQIKTTCAEAYEHQVYPFDRLVDELDLARDVSRNPLFDVVVAVQHETTTRLSLGGARVSGFIDDYQGSKYDLQFSFELRDAVLDASIVYNTDLFGPQRIERMKRHLIKIADNVLADSQQTVQGVDMLSDAERHQLLFAWNGLTRDFPRDKCIHQLFEDQAKRTAELDAVVFGDQRLTYGELNARANQLAGHLRHLGVGPEVLVGICLERSLEMVTGLLAILKAGGAYVPLDPEYPARRLAFMLQDMQAQVLLTQQRLLAKLPECNARVICLDADWLPLLQQPKDNLTNETTPENLAYVIYTSGSTGQPKGVMIEHRSLANLVGWHQAEYAVKPGDRASQFASFAFDASVWELWPYLTAGATVYLADSPANSTPAELIGWLQSNRIAISFLPTPLAEAVIKEAWPETSTLRALLTGGDRLRSGPRRPLPMLLTNQYGPTENTVVTTWEVVGSSSWHSRPPPIGRPLPNVQVYVLDKHGKPVPVGITGELHIGGIQLARGYLNRPDLTAEMFIRNPFSCDPAARLYKSGDLCRWTPDGKLEFRGRLDDQVKLRGYRIELGEIETHLSAHEHVREAVVLIREDEPGQKRLVAYVALSTASEQSGQIGLRQYLLERLPEYMVPAAFVQLDELPLTANNKVDRHALPAPNVSRLHVEPRDELEQVVAGIFAEVLRSSRVGAYDNFFELGGDSLLATQVVTRLRDMFRADLSIVGLFTAQDVASLAEVLRDKTPRNQADKIAGAVRRLQSMTNEEKRQLASHNSR